MNEHRVTAAEHGMRLDALLATLPELASRGHAVRHIEAGRVQLNGTTITAKKRLVLAGDTLSLELLLEQPETLCAEHIELDIRYEDEHLIVLSKQAGLVVHPAHGHESGTLVNALIAHCGYENLALLQGEDRPGIVHRLDKDTSGLMLVAKSEQAGLALTEGIRTRNVDRRYLTLVHGYIAPNTGLVDAPLARGGSERKRMVVSTAAGSRDAVTTFTVLERYEARSRDDGYCYLECKLYTGRTHQIRAHMSHISHPCVGDPLYGRLGPAAQLGLERQFLHSWQLVFEHPLSGAEMRFEDKLPGDLAAALSSIEDRRMS